MAEMKVSERIEAPAEAVWELFRDFGGVMRYTPALEGCAVEGEGVGAVRTIHLPGGASLKERLEALDESAKRLQYSILEGPLPVQNYLATIEVHSDGHGTRVDWSSQFDPVGLEDGQVIAILEGVYQGGLAGIRSVLSV